MTAAALIGLIIGFGAFGGFVSYLLAPTSGTPPLRNWAYVVIGVAAALLVPLFLNMTSSTLLEDLIRDAPHEKQVVKGLVLAGFCLVAAISAQAFIQKISTAILNQQVQRLAGKVAGLRESVQPLVAKETEPEPGFPVTAARAAATTSDAQQKILHALRDGPFTLRSLSGISKDAGLPATDVQMELAAMVAAGLAGRRTAESGPRWFITETGRAAAT